MFFLLQLVRHLLSHCVACLCYQNSCVEFYLQISSKVENVCEGLLAVLCVRFSKWFSQEFILCIYGPPVWSICVLAIAAAIWGIMLCLQAESKLLPVIGSGHQEKRERDEILSYFCVFKELLFVLSNWSFKTRYMDHMGKYLRNGVTTNRWIQRE